MQHVYFKSSQKKKKNIILYVIITGIIVCLLQTYVGLYYKMLKCSSEQADVEKFRAMEIAEECTPIIFGKNKKITNTDIESLTVNMLLQEYRLKDKKHLVKKVERLPGIKAMKESEIYKWLFSNYQSIFKDIEYFPVPQDITGNAGFSFENSWGFPRTYGGNRHHEGTDIMADNNKRSYFPVISVSDGVIEQKGWLEKGGYRIGIRSKAGAYFYYAHLSAYAENLEIGDSIKAGQMIGLMGDTGYSKIEGTTGNFPVHLHFGIYLGSGKQEQSVNPYYVLKFLEANKLKFNPPEKSDVSIP